MWRGSRTNLTGQLLGLETINGLRTWITTSHAPATRTGPAF